MGKFRHLPVVLGLLSLIANIFLNNYFGASAIYILWLTIILLLIEIAFNEVELSNLKNSKPNIVLKDFGFEIKQWQLFSNTVCAYIDVANEPKENSSGNTNSDGLTATIIWTDEKENVLDTNKGRWFIPNEDQHGAIKLQMVDLGANGLKRRLHFTLSTLETRILQSFWRTEDNKNASMPRMATNGVHISISLTDNQNTKVNFYFLIIPEKSQEGEVLIIKNLSTKNGKVIKTKTFAFKELEKFNRENSTNIFG